MRDPMTLSREPIWPEVDDVFSAGDRIDCQIDIDGGNRRVSGRLHGSGNRFVADVAVSADAPKYQQEQEGLFYYATSSGRVGSNRQALSIWLAEKMDHEVNRMKAAYNVAQAIAKEEASS